MEARYHRFNWAFFILYFIGITAFMIWQGVGITPDRYVWFLLFASLLIHNTRRFLLDWTPFIFILISYDFFRGFADNLNPKVHFVEQLNIDKWLFGGQVPAAVLQQLFHTVGTPHWYDYLATMAYFLHFALPLGFAFLIWLRNAQQFRQFTSSLLFLSYSAFVTYVFYPAAPPWLANKEGYLPGITKIIDETLKTFPERLRLPTIYHNFDPNLVAAIPSLHAAYPFLVMLFGLYIFGKKALWFMPYVLFVWISIIYLGEHYVFDVLLGAIYAGITFVLCIHWGRINRMLHLPKRLSL